MDGETVWFPLSALVRIEVGSSGVIGGWADETNSIGLAECLRPTAEDDAWIVTVSGTAIAVPSPLVRSMFRRSMRFSSAAAVGLHGMACDARRIAVSQIRDRAQIKIAKLLIRLDRATPANDRIALNQGEIGRWLGLQRTTVCTAMKDMKTRKLINYARTYVAIVDREGLSHLEMRQAV